MRIASLPLYAYELAAGCAVVVSLGACTTLGPMPAVTGQSIAPEPRPNVEVQAGVMPGFFLSSAVSDKPKGTPVSQAAAMFEPDELISLPGLSVGGRYVGGKDEGAYAEPMLRYRTLVDAEKRIAIGVVGYGTHASGEDRGASYSANRVGGEAGADLRMTDRSSWAELHMYAGASATGIFADGRYCEDPTTGYARDCPEGQTGDVRADLSGVFPSAFAGASLDFARHMDSAFHGIRLATFAAGGLMPTYQNAQREENKTYATIGVALTVGLGATARQDGTR
jgi:hypothetical protein